MIMIMDPKKQASMKLKFKFKQKNLFRWPHAEHPGEILVPLVSPRTHGGTHLFLQI